MVRSDSQVAIPEPVQPKARATPWVIGMGLVAALVAGAQLLRSPDAQSALPPVKTPDSPVAVNPPPVATVTPAVPADSTGKKDTVARPQPTVGRILVTVPENATVSVNGKEEALGGWSSDSLKPGVYRIAAKVEAPAGCATSVDEETVTVRASRSRMNVALSPRSCGTLSFGSNMRDSRWSLVSLTGGENIRREGVVPATNVVLPVGDYQRAISRTKCITYTDTIRVAANRTDRLPNIPMMCPLDRP